MIDGLQCNEAEQLLFRIHANLDIIINGQYLLVKTRMFLALPLTTLLLLTPVDIEADGL